MGVHPVLKDYTPAGGRDNGDRPAVQRFDTGAERGTDNAGLRLDLISWVALRRLGETLAEGAAKYGDHNWRFGIDQSNLINHALIHIHKYNDGDRSEDHLAHAMCNLMFALDNDERRPQMLDGLLGADGSLTDSIRLRLDRFRALRAAKKEGEVSVG
jgi:hypothetical protein